MTRHSLQEAFQDILKIALWPLNLAFNWSASMVNMYFGWNNPFEDCYTADSGFVLQEGKIALATLN